jgi:hypothetical protein
MDTSNQSNEIERSKTYHLLTVNSFQYFHCMSFLPFPEGSMDFLTWLKMSEWKINLKMDRRQHLEAYKFLDSQMARAAA